QYRLQCLQTMYDSDDTSCAVQFMLKLGTAYWKLGFNDQALSYFDKVMHHSLSDPYDTLFYYETVSNKAILLANTGHPYEGIQLLNGATRTTLAGKQDYF